MPYIIGVDIGGTKIDGILYNGTKIVRELTVVTPKNIHDFRDTLIHLATFLSAGHPVHRIGLGIAGLVDAKRRTLKSGGNNLQYLEGFNFAGFLRHGGFTDVRMQNDAKCFTLAELCLGHGKTYKNFVGLTLGTGIGGGLVANGALYEGWQNGAGEIGHGLMNAEGDFEGLFQAAKTRRGDAWGNARKDHDFKKIGTLLGKAVAAISYLYDPEAVILGGGVAQLYHAYFLPQALKTAKQSMRQNRSLPKVHISNLKYPGALGAALLFSHPGPI